MTANQDKKKSPLKKSKLAPDTGAVEFLLKRVSQEFANLSAQLKQIASYIEQHHDRLGIEKIQDIASHCGVQPSAVVRFAQHFGFSGYTEMQKIFREGMAAQISHNHNYQTRIREVIDHSQQNLSTQTIAQTYLDGAIAGMQDLQKQLQRSPNLSRAVDLLAQAPSLWVVGARRAFPVATYLAYSLQHTDKPVHIITGMGAMHDGQLRSLRKDDVMIAISFTPYAEETVRAVEQAHLRGVKVIAITDSRMSPISQHEATSLLVSESSVFGFRSLTNAMVLAQSLFIALAYRLEIDYQPTHATAV
jgi:DNA-binding MurR/RpiR family transcriptional regulator